MSTLNSNATSPPPRFLSFPPEIRIIIYREIFVNRPKPSGRWDGLSRPLQILRTCRQIHSEALHVMHTEVTWNIKISNNDGPGWGTLVVANLPVGQPRDQSSQTAGLLKALPQLRRFSITVSCSNYPSLIKESIDEAFKLLWRASKIDYLRLELDEAGANQFAKTIGVVLGLLRNVKTVVIDTVPWDGEDGPLDDRWAYRANMGGKYHDREWTPEWDVWCEGFKAKVQGSEPINPLPGMYWRLKNYVDGIEWYGVKNNIEQARFQMEEDDIRYFKRARARIVREIKKHLEDMDRLYASDPPAEGPEDEEPEFGSLEEDGQEDGGSEDGGSEDGGSEDGGSEDGGSENGGSEVED